MIAGLQLIEKNILTKIYDKLDKIGILYRIFSRIKDEKSIYEKINRKSNQSQGYSEDGKKMQDVIGIRIVTYFQDDIELVKEILSTVINYSSEEIDQPELTVFKPKRTNIICKFSKDDTERFNEVKASSRNPNFTLCDNTFELQLRTILSEGWHEIDHSLRYKCKNEWEGHKEKERMLNGIYASLEVNDLALKALFLDLAYQHFKLRNWEAMIRHKFRIRFQQSPLDDKIMEELNQDNEIAKRIVKLDRELMLKKISDLDISLPLNFTNFIFIINMIELKNEKILSLTPELVKNICS